MAHLRLYVAFCSHYRLRDVPADAHTLALFLEFLMRSFRAPKSALNTLASVRHLHLQLGATTAPFDHYNLCLSRRALTLSVRHVPSPAPPCNPATLRRLILASRQWGVRGLAFAAMCSIAFHTLARLSSLAPPALPFDATRYPTCADVIHGVGYWLLSVKFAKCSQAAAQGFRVPLLASQDPVVCPVRLLRALLLAHGSLEPSDPLFVVQPGLRGRATAALMALTAPEARAMLRRALDQTLGPGSGFTFHSFRRGGATLAALRGASPGDVKALGHWTSDSALAYFPALPAQLRAAGALTGSPVTLP